MIRSVQILAVLLAAATGSAATGPCIITTVLAPDSMPTTSPERLHSVRDLEVINGGAWFAVVAIRDGAAPITDVLLSNTDPLLRSGDPLSAPAGTTMEHVHWLSANNHGDLVYKLIVDGLDPNHTALYVNGSMIAERFGPAPGSAADARYAFLQHAVIDDDGRVILAASIESPSKQVARDALVMFTPTASGAYTETIMLTAGDALPGSKSSFLEFRTGSGGPQLGTDHGGRIALRLVGQSQGNRRSRIGRFDYTRWPTLEFTSLAVNLDPTPGSGYAWLLSDPHVDLGRDGHYLIPTDALPGTFEDPVQLLTLNNERFLIDGDIIGGGEATFAAYRAAVTDDHGEVAWIGRWTEAPDDTVFGLFINRRPLVWPGVTSVDGMTLEDVTELSMSDSGQHVMFVADVQTDDGLTPGMYMVAREPGPCFIENLDCDGRVGFGDLLTIMSLWGPCADICFEDFDRNGQIDFGEVLQIIFAWGACNAE